MAEGAIAVLVIENDITFHAILGDYLRNEGYTVDIALTGEEARDFFHHNSYGVIILDLYLPNVSGETILKEITAANLSSTIIVISGISSEAEMISCYDMGADFVLHKPFKLTKINDLIKRSHILNKQDARFSLKQNVEGWIELTADSYFGFLERIKNVIQVLRIAKLSDEVQQDITMALDEMGRNAIEWGNGNNSSKKIAISYALFAHEIVFKIEDEGMGFEQETTPSDDVLSRLLERKKEGKRPGGFGIAMVKKVMDKVVYNQRGNIVLISKSLK